MENKIKIFENKQVRTAWNADEEEWYFSVVNVVAVLMDSADPNNYRNAKIRCYARQQKKTKCNLCLLVMQNPLCYTLICNENGGSCFI